MEHNRINVNRNIASSLITTLSSVVVPFLMYCYTTRVISVASIGKVSFVQSFLQYFIYFASLGIACYGRRECAKLIDNRKACSEVFCELAAINIILTVGAYILLIICVVASSHLQTYKNLIIAMGYYVALSSINCEWIYQAYGRFSTIMLRSLIMKAVAFLLVIMFVREDGDYIFYGVLVVFAASASGIMNILGLRELVDFSVPRPEAIVKHIQPILLLFTSTLLITLYANADIIMLSVLSGDYQTGLYNTVLKIKSAAVAISTGATDAIIPSVSYSYALNRKENITDLGAKTVRVICLFTIPLAVFCSVFSKSVLTILFGSDYTAAAPALIGNMVIAVLLCFTNLVGNQLLIPLGKERRFSKSVLVGFFINLTINFLLIPKYGAVGAVIGTLATELWNFIYMSGAIKLLFMEIVKKSGLLKYLSIITILMPLIILVQKLAWVGDNIFKCALVGIVYLVLYYLLLIAFKEPTLNAVIKRVKDVL